MGVNTLDIGETSYSMLADALDPGQASLLLTCWLRERLSSPFPAFKTGCADTLDIGKT